MRSRRRQLVFRLAATLVIACSGIAATAEVAQATFPGSNGKLVFVRGSDLWTMDPDGSGIMALDISTRRPGVRNPSWSPDGSRIVFNRCCTADFDHIDVVDADGRNQSSVWNGDTVTWGVDGHSLLFQYYHPSPDFDGRFSIWTVDLDTVSTASLSHPTLRHGDDYAPAVSPDGSTIAFTRCCFKHPAHVRWSDIFMMAADGSGETRLTDNRTNDGQADWAPDGSRIVFAHGRHIALMDPDGTDLLVLRRNSQRRDSSPIFSPDGTKIAFIRCCFGSSETTEIMTMDIDGSDLSRLTDNELMESGPSWQPLG